MSWLFSQALVEAYSVENSWDGEPSVPSSGTHTQQAFLSHGKMTAFSRLSRFGMTFKPLMDSRGEALLKWFLEGFPARTFHRQERVPGSTEKPLPCGSIWLESAVRYCLDSSSWRTHRCLWDEVLPESSVTLPQWGMMQDGVLWERTMPAHLTSETESGCWVGTPTASMTARSEVFAEGRIPTPEEFVKRWPTPRAQDAKHANCTEYELLRNQSLDLLHVAVARRTWPTPTVDDASNVNPKANRFHGLVAAVNIKETFPTPKARDWKNGTSKGPEDWTGDLGEAVNPSKDGGSLNPTWVEWLMGWTLEWTDLKPLGMGKFQQWCDSHGKSYQKEASHDLP